MGFGTIIGWMFGGFAVRVYAGAGAAWMATYAVKPLQQVAEAVQHLQHLQ